MSAEPAVLERAIAFAVEKHCGRKDSAGQPYILHPLRVMVAVTTEDEQVVAVLHDVVEDSDATFEDLERLGLSTAALGALRLLTQDDGARTEAGYLAYVGRLKRDRIARAVKLADLADSFHAARLRQVTPQDADRLAKYLKARAVLLWPERRG